ncbi:MAG: ERF family protein [Oscillospiraceae bacterium]|nr:ERF family protein [Oscillospiraceae bacterium]MBQ8996377.1 ERF family protein [Oscillospiraceae bacterium]
MNIYEKISAIMKDVQYLAKDDHVEFASTKYKAISEEKVTTIMRAELLKYNLVVFPVEMTWTRIGNISHVDVLYKMVDTETGDSIAIASCGDGADTQDKGSGKAMTYAFKYMWLRTFAIPTGEDPDKVSSDELDAKEAKEKARMAPPSKELVEKLKAMCTEEQWDKTLKTYGDPKGWTTMLTEKWIKQMEAKQKGSKSK